MTSFVIIQQSTGHVQVKVSGVQQLEFFQFFFIPFFLMMSEFGLVMLMAVNQWIIDHYHVYTSPPAQTSVFLPLLTCWPTLLDSAVQPLLQPAVLSRGNLCLQDIWAWALHCLLSSCSLISSHFLADRCSLLNWPNTILSIIRDTWSDRVIRISD